MITVKIFGIINVPEAMHMSVSGLIIVRVLVKSLFSSTFR